MPEHRLPEHRREPSSTAHTNATRQWVWVGGVAAVLIAAVVLVVGVIAPRNGGLMSGPTPTRHVVQRKTPDEAFPGGLAMQPKGVNQPGIREDAARASGDTTLANQIGVIANQPIATWLTNGVSTAKTLQTVHAVVEHAKVTHATPTFVLYAIPDRDCGGYSKGGMTPAEYVPWAKQVVKAMAGSHAVVLVEPDSIAQISNCKRLESTRIPLLKKTVDAIAGHGVTIYLDGGNENRVPVQTMAARLRQAGIDRVQGFFTNVSNFYRVDQERSYADKLADAIGRDPHFVIDVSRNAKGWLGTWCNPSGAGLGQSPHVTAGSTRLDALLWVKTPGLSDGTCNGGPAAGQWWQSYALALVANRAR